MLSLPSVPLCVLGGLSVGVCPPHMCDGLTCLCHQGSSIITINLGGSSRPADSGPLTARRHQESPKLKKRQRTPSLPSPTSLPPSSPFSSRISRVHFAPPDQTHLRRVVKRKKSLKTVMFVNLHTHIPSSSFLFLLFLPHVHKNTHTVCTPRHKHDFFAGCNYLHTLTNRKRERWKTRRRTGGRTLAGL